MAKKVLLLLLVFSLSISIVGCGSQVPEAVQDLQHKIDKALESEPSYSTLKEIQEMYDDLLKEEQELVTGYDELAKYFALSDKDVAGIYAIKELKTMLKVPSSLELLSANVVPRSGCMAVKLDYVAENSAGGKDEDTYYCIVDTPKFDSKTEQWSCSLESLFSNKYKLEMISSIMGKLSGTKSSGSGMGSAQDMGKDYYNAGTPVSLDVEKLTDNVNLNIHELNKDN